MTAAQLARHPLWGLPPGGLDPAEIVIKPFKSQHLRAQCSRSWDAVCRLVARVQRGYFGTTRMRP